MSEATNSHGEGSPLSRRSFLGGLAAGAATLGSGGILSACGGASTSDQANVAARRGGSLRVGIGGGGPTDSLDAHAPIAPTDIARVLNLYDGLGDDTKEAKYAPLLAEEFEPNERADEWTIRIKQGAEFHNGKTIGADDVIFTIRRIIDPKEPKNAAPVMRSIDSANISKLDERTVRLRLRQPDAVLRDAFRILNTGIVPVGYDPRRPVGSGPFELVSFDPGEQSVFRRFANYHGRAPFLDELTIVDLADDTARVNALLGGQVQAIDSVPYSQVDVIRGDGRMRLLTSKAGSFRPFTMRVDRAPFDDVRVRQAMRLVIDRDQMVRQALAGHGRVAHDVYSPNDPCFDRSLVRERDVAQARSLLRQAGQQDLRVQLATTPAAPGLVEASQVLAERAREAGITVRVRRLDPGSFFADYLSWPFAVDYWTHNSYLNQVALGELPTSTLNPSHFDDEEFNRLNREARAQPDEKLRCEIAQQMQRISFERGGLIIWGYADTIDAHSAAVGGLSPDLTGWSLNRYRFRSAFLAA